MAVSFVANGGTSGVAQTGTTSITITGVAGCNVDDLLFLWVHNKGTNAPNGLSGWTNFHTMDTTSGRVHLYRRWVTSGGTQADVTVSNLTSSSVGSMAAFRGVNTSTPFVQHSAAGSYKAQANAEGTYSIPHATGAYWADANWGDGMAVAIIAVDNDTDSITHTSWRDSAGNGDVSVTDIAFGFTTSGTDCSGAWFCIPFANYSTSGDNLAGWGCSLVEGSAGTASNACVMFVLKAAGATTHEAQATRATTATITAGAARTVDVGLDELPITATVTATAGKVHTVAAIRDTTATLTAAATRTQPVAASLAVTATITTTGNVTTGGTLHEAQATLSGTATLTAGALRTATVGAALAVTATRTAGLSRTAAVAAALAVTATRTAGTATIAGATLAVTCTRSLIFEKSTPGGGGSPSFRSWSYGVSGGATGTVTCSPPSGYQADDIFIAHVLNDSSSAVMSTPATGYTLLAGPHGTSMTSWIYWKRAVASESNATWTITTSDELEVVISAWQSASTTNDPTGSQQDNSTAAYTWGFPAITPPVADSLIVALVGVDGSSGETTDFGSWGGSFVERYDFSEPEYTTERECWLGAASYVAPNTNQITGITVTGTQTTAERSTTAMVALRPGGTSGTTYEFTAARPITATISAAATRTKTVAASLAVTATLTTTGDVQTGPTQIQATLDITASRTATADVLHPVAAALSLTATLTTTAIAGIPIAAARDTTATLTAAALLTRGVAATLPVTATLTTGIARTAVIGASLAVTATRTTAATTGAPYRIPNPASGGQVVETEEFPGPICDTNGNLYYLLEGGSGDSYAYMMKSTDGGISWAEVDNAGKPATNDNESMWMAQDPTQTGRVRLLQMDSSYDATHHLFYTSDHASTPDEWGTTDTVLYAGSTAPVQCTCIVITADGDAFAFYAHEAVGGQPKFGYRRWNGSTWDTEVVMDSGQSYGCSQIAAVAGASNKVHIFGHMTHTSPPQVWHRSLDNAGTLSAWERVDSSGASTDSHGLTNAVYHDVGGTERVHVGWLDSSTGYLHTGRVDNDGTPTTDGAASHAAVAASFLGSESPVAALAVDGATLHALYCDSSTQDLWRRESPTGAGSWTTQYELRDAISGQWLFANVYTRGGVKRLGFVYEAGSADQYDAWLYYGEVSLVSAAASLAVTATLTTAANVTAGGTTHEAQATLAATATLSTALTRTQAAAASLPVTVTLSTAGALTAAGQASLPVTATLSAGAALTLPAAATLAATATLSAAAAPTRLAGASLSVTATRSASLTLTRPPSIRTVQNPTLANTTTTFTINKPAGLANGEVMYAVAFRDTNTAPTSEPSFGTTLATIADATNALWMRLYRKVVTDAANEPASWTWTWAAASSVTGLVAVAQNVDNTTPEDGVTPTQNSGGAGFTIPTIDPATVGALVVAFAGVHDDLPNVSGFSSTSGPTMALDGLSVSSGGVDCQVAVGSGVSTDGAATGTISVTSASDPGGGFALVLRPVSMAVEMDATRATTATITAGGWVEHPVAATRASTATVTVGAAVEHPVAAALPVTVTLSTAGDVFRPPVEVAASRASSATITAGGLREAVTGATLALSAVVEAAGVRAAPVAANRATTATVSTAGEVTHPVAAQVATTVTITAGGARLVSVAVSLPLAATLTAAGLVGLVAARQTTVTISTAAAVARVFAAAVPVNATIATTAYALAYAAAALAVTATRVAGIVGLYPTETSLDIAASLLADAFVAGPVEASVSHSGLRFPATRSTADTMPGEGTAVTASITLTRVVL